jgi:hypothetical protein
MSTLTIYDQSGEVMLTSDDVVWNVVGVYQVAAWTSPVIWLPSSLANSNFMVTVLGLGIGGVTPQYTINADVPSITVAAGSRDSIFTVFVQ